MMSTATTLALTITWDPTIRGMLVVLVSFSVLAGSAYLLVSTNVGSRLGFLIAAGAFWGWMTIMGMAWWVYGIGYKGPPPTWVVEEVLTSARPNDTSAASLEPARDLSTWEELPEGDVIRGEAQASADEALAGEDSRVASFDATADYVTIDAFAVGGKDPNSALFRLPLSHPPQYALVQVRAVVPVVTLAEGETCPAGSKCINFGETPPKPEPDSQAPVVSVIMVRDLGALRLPSAVVTLSSATLFAIVCNALHRRDKAASEHQAEARASTAG